MCVQHLLDGFTDSSERNHAFEKGGDGCLVGRIEDGRRGSSGLARRDAGTERAKDIGPNRLEGERARRDRVESSGAGVRKPFGMGDACFLPDPPTVTSRMPS